MELTGSKTILCFLRPDALVSLVDFGVLFPGIHVFCSLATLTLAANYINTSISRDAMYLVYTMVDAYIYIRTYIFPMHTVILQMVCIIYTHTYINEYIICSIIIMYVRRCLFKWKYFDVLYHELSGILRTQGHQF